MRQVRRAGLVLALAVLAAMPVGAGATGHAALAMLAFAGLFVLGNAVMRAGAVRLDRPGDLALQVVTATAFAALLVGLGQSLRALVGIETATDLFGWVFAGAWALLLARLVWPPKLIGRVSAGAETGLRRLHEAGGARGRNKPAGRATASLPTRRPEPRNDPRPPPRRGNAGPTRRAAAPPPSPGREPADPARTGTAGPAEPDPSPAQREEHDTTMTESEPASRAAPAPHRAPDPEIARALDRLDHLPLDGASETALEEALAAVEADPALAAAPGALVPALAHRAELHGTERDRTALVVMATAPASALDRLGQGDAAMAFERVVSAADAVSLLRFATRARALIESVPEAAADLPTVPRLIEIADQIEDAHEAEAEALVDLASALEDLFLSTEPEAEDGGDGAGRQAADTATDEVDA